MSSANYTPTPFRFRDFTDRVLITNEAGDFAFFEDGVIDRFFNGGLTVEEEQSLRDMSVLVGDDEHWRLASLARRLERSRSSGRDRISYFMVIPTLRCDLSCSYCQVSRAPIDALGFDWDEERLTEFERFVSSFGGGHIKLEFQGGEPSLRPDLIRSIVEVCERHFEECEFVVCTNLTNISPEAESLYERDDFYLSTSIDGSIAAMSENRTNDDEVSRAVFRNINYILETYGPDKLSALPTVTEATLDKPESIIDTYRSFGFNSIFLRPVNYMGFARKQHRGISERFDRWTEFYERALSHIVAINDEAYFEEFYLGNLVRAVFADQTHGFVDFRSPSRFLSDYGVVDFDGQIYPSDESRMLARIGHVDLTMGSLKTGIDRSKLAELNFNALHHVNPDCVHCAYMPYCGIDVIDDLSRYNRIDPLKHETWFCRQHMTLFDLVFSKVAQKDRRWLDVFLRWILKRHGHLRGYEVFQ